MQSCEECSAPVHIKFKLRYGKSCFKAYVKIKDPGQPSKPYSLTRNAVISLSRRI